MTTTRIAGLAAVVAGGLVQGLTHSWVGAALGLALIVAGLARLIWDARQTP